MNIPPRLILVPLDFSEFANSALDVGADLAKRLGSELCLVYIVPALPRLPMSVSIFKEGDYEQGLHKDAEGRLNEIVKNLAKESVRAKVHVGTANDVPSEIVRIAEEEKVDLIVIASHGATGWNRWVLGSVAEKVVHIAPCPVLILRSNQEAAGHDPSAKSDTAKAAG
jgi:nucleotide-binding universal stress UspA family protein